jgi:hypothetical protein
MLQPNTRQRTDYLFFFLNHGRGSSVLLHKNKQSTCVHHKQATEGEGTTKQGGGAKV